MDLLALPFDQYQRYRLVADLLDGLRPKGRALTILDVGGRTALLREFLPKDTITAVDLEVSEAPDLVLGDGSCLPFKDGSFDVVAGFDTLEHVPPSRRDAFIDECARVSNHWVVLIGPYGTARVDEAEERLVEFVHHKLKAPHRYLDEHRSNGLPILSEVAAALEGHGMRTVSWGQGNLDRWLALMCLELYLDADPCLRPFAKQFFRFYNETLYDSDWGGDVYRHALVGAKGRSRLPKKAPGQSTQPAPRAASQAVMELALDLLAFDSEADVWRPEQDRLKGVIADLEADLRGHKTRLADTQMDLAGHKQQLEEVESDLVGHKTRLADVQEDLAGHKQQLVEVGSDLEGHHSKLREVSEDLSRHKARLKDVLTDLEGHQAALQAKDATLNETTDHLARVTAEMDSQALAAAGQAQELRKEIESATLAYEEQVAAGAAQRVAALGTEKKLRAELQSHAEVRQELLEEQAALRSNQVELNLAFERLQVRLEQSQEELCVSQEEHRGTQEELAQSNALLEHLRKSLRCRMDNLKRILRGRGKDPFIPPQ